jgi:Protein trafficking PGA2
MAQEPINPFQKILADGQTFYIEATKALSTWKGNFIRNTSSSFNRMTAKNWLRLVIIVCTYCLIRPYILKLGAKVQESYLEKEAKESDEKWAAMHPNDLRAGGRKNVDIPGVESEDEGEDGMNEVVVKGEWGRKARVRQRKIVRKAMEIHEANLTRTGYESDQDIADLLED